MSSNTIAFAIVLGIIAGILIDVNRAEGGHVVQVAEAATTTPQEVRIEVVKAKEVRVATNLTTEEIAAMIADTFPEDPIKAVAVGKAESGKTLYPRAYNPEWHYINGKPVCQGSYGVMQIACVHHLENPEALYDVEFNLQKAREIYDKHGWSKWGGYSSGGYLKYMQ